MKSKKVDGKFRIGGETKIEQGARLKRLVLLLGLILCFAGPASAQLAFSPGTLAAPTASPVAGSYAGTQTVTLSEATTTNAFICYTTDGSTPTGNATSCGGTGTHYTAGFTVSSTTTIKAAAFQGYWRPSGVFTGVYTITFAPTIAAHAQNPNCSTATCNLNITWPAGTQAVLYQLVWNTTDTLTHAWDCAGSSTCGASTDTLVAGQACTVHSSETECSYYICNSSLAAGAANFTALFGTMTGTAIQQVYAISGAPTSSCYDTGGTATTGSGTGTVTTSGNITGSTDLVLAFTLGVGTATAGAGYTAVDNLGSKMSESSNASPASGAPTTATWGGSSGGWANVVDAIK